MLWVTHTSWWDTALIPWLNRAPSILPELISLAVLQSLSLLTLQNSTIHTQPRFTHRQAGVHTRRMRGHRLAPSVSREGKRRASPSLPPGWREGPAVPAVAAEPGASGGRWVATAARRRGERGERGGRGRGRGGRKRGRGEDAGTRYGAKCLPVPRWKTDPERLLRRLERRCFVNVRNQILRAVSKQIPGSSRAQVSSI